MNGLPLPEPPADDIDEVLERLHWARAYRDDATNTLSWLRTALAELEPEDPVERRHHLVIEINLAESRLIRWGVHIERLSKRAQALGLRP